MSLKNMKKDELELLSNKDITYLILEESSKTLNTASLFQKIIKLLELPENYFETKIADYYTALTTDKRFILLEDGTWDLRSRHTSDKVIKVEDDDEEEEEDEEENADKDDQADALEEDNYDDNSEDDDYDDANEDLKDLVVIDEDELELEE